MYYTCTYIVCKPITYLGMNLQWMYVVTTSTPRDKGFEDQPFPTNWSAGSFVASIFPSHETGTYRQASYTSSGPCKIPLLPMYNTSNSLVLPSTSYVYVYTFLRDCAASGCLDPWFYLMCQLASSPPVDNKASQWQRRGEACFCFCSLVDRTVMCRKSGRYNNRGNSNLSYVAALRATRSILTGLSEAIRRERTPHTFGGIWCIMVPTLCIMYV